MWESLLVSLVLLGTPLGIQADEQCELKILTGYNSAEFRSTELRCSWPKHCCGRVLDCCLVWYFWILVGGSFGLLSSCCLICIRCFLCTAERANVVPAQTTVLYTYANGSPHHHHHHHSSPMPPSEDGSTTTHQFLVPATLRFVPPVPGGPFVSQGPPPSYEQTTAQASAAEGAEGAAAVSVATLPPSSEPPPSFEQATGGRRAYLQSTAQPNRPSSSPFPGAPASPTAADRRPTRQPVLPSRLPPINIQRSPSIQAELDLAAEAGGK